MPGFNNLIEQAKKNHPIASQKRLSAANDDSKHQRKSEPASLNGRNSLSASVLAIRERHLKNVERNMEKLEKAKERAKENEQKRKFVESRQTKISSAPREVSAVPKVRKKEAPAALDFSKLMQVAQSNASKPSAMPVERELQQAMSSRSIDKTKSINNRKPITTPSNRIESSKPSVNTSRDSMSQTSRERKRSDLAPQRSLSYNLKPATSLQKPMQKPIHKPVQKPIHKPNSNDRVTQRASAKSTETTNAIKNSALGKRSLTNAKQTPRVQNQRIHGFDSLKRGNSSFTSQKSTPIVDKRKPNVAPISNKLKQTLPSQPKNKSIVKNSYGNKSGKPLLPFLEHVSSSSNSKVIAKSAPKPKPVARPSYGSRSGQPLLPFLEQVAPASNNASRRYHDEGEEDSDLDGFIVDDEEEDEGIAPTKISKLIRSMTGYDPSRYNDDDDDTRCMEASYKDIAVEERRAERIARQEDLIEQQREEERTMLKKKMRKGEGNNSKKSRIV